ncbi:hypothetical protein [Chamaesiphon sp.]
MSVIEIRSNIERLDVTHNLAGGQCPPYWLDTTKTVGNAIAQKIINCIL